jgi:glutathione synthase/RimK-type ligase-like ATP-grasp enzyme
LRKVCLFITQQYEVTVDFLLAALRAREVPCLRWNLDQFPSSSTLSYRAGDNSFNASILTDGRTLDLGDVASIWCRGLLPSGFPHGINEADEKFAKHECQRALNGLLSTLSALWVNHPECNRRANSKPAQLFAAQKIGFHIPPTLITNNPAEARAFITEPGDTIYKANSPLNVFGSGKMVFTSIVTDAALDKIDLIQLTPGIFQKLIPKAYEVRATVVGSRIFCAKIDSQADPETELDWRRKPFNIESTLITMPSAVEQKVLELMRLFDISYGAFDFIVTPDGRYVFLEVNPSGQYLWIEHITKLPITEAIVDLLSAGCRA